MGKKSKLLFCIFFALLFIGFVGAGDFINITPDCTICVPGYAATWKVAITNKGQETMTIVQLKLKDSATGREFAHGNFTHMIDYTANGLRSSVKWAEIPSGESATFMLYGTIPPPTNGRELFYEFCRSQATPLHAIGDLGKQYEFCYKTNRSLTLYDCKETKECKSSQVCSDNLCADLQCSSCQYTENHFCYSYECCNDTHCFLNETCSDHLCSSIPCNEGNIINHTCTSEECAPDEALIDFLCRKLNCTKAEYISDHRCQPLNCGRDEFFLNHTCQKLFCKNDEIYEKQSCVPAACKENSFVSNHTCVSCHFFQNAKEDYCSLNIKLVLLLIFLLFIIITVKRTIIMFRRVQTRKMTLKLMKVVKKKPQSREKDEGNAPGKGGTDVDDKKEAPGTNKIVGK